VLSYGYWQEHYGGAESAIGSTVSLDRHTFQVVGVAPPGFYGMEVGEKFDIAVPVCSLDVFDGNRSRLDDRSFWWMRVAGRIKPGIDRPQLLAHLTAMSLGVFGVGLPQDWSADGQRAL
jgi:putative ABC transport system permease protein